MVWRDSQQRLVWGINDFDDACELPFTSDLARLATSTMLAASSASIDVTADTICAFILQGYRIGLRKAEPIVIPADANTPLAKLLRNTHEDPEKFWRKKLDPEKNPEVDGPDLPKGLEDMFRASFRSRARPSFRNRKPPAASAASGGAGSLRSKRSEKASTRHAKPKHSCRRRSIG